MIKHLWLAHIRPIVYPWYMERDPDKGFKRWLRETENGQAGYRRFRATVLKYEPELVDEWPDKLGYE